MANAGAVCPREYGSRMTMPPVGREAAHVLLDAVSAYSGGATDEANIAAMDLALRRLHDIGAVDVEERDGVTGVDVSNIVGPSVVMLYWLARTAAQGTEEDELGVIARLREFVDAPA